MSSGIVQPRPGLVLADLLPAATRTRAWVRDAVLILSGAVLTGLAAQLSLPVPGSPVPVTGQTFAVLAVGATLGASRGFLAQALYLLAGVAGVPWYAGGTHGAFGASFGYVIGFPIAAAVVGALARRGADRGPLRTLGAMAVGSVLIYAVGVPWLAASSHLTLSAAISLGLVPYLLGDAIKAALAMGVLPTAWKLAERRDG